MTLMMTPVEKVVVFLLLKRTIDTWLILEPNI